MSIARPRFTGAERQNDRRTVEATRERPSRTALRLVLVEVQQETQVWKPLEAKNPTPPS